ncbi:MAG: hypothetical protein LUG85_04135 [Clostridiales bacterium]|nr:hypothetical protein [Clostridiales bacterium]
MSEENVAKNKNTKGIIRIIAYVAVIIAVIVIIILVWNSQRNSSTEVDAETASDTASVTVSDDTDDSAGTTAASGTETTTSSGSSSGLNTSAATTAPSSSSNTNTNANETAEIEAFLSGSFYMVFTSSSDSSSSPIEMAISGNDFQMSMDMDGMTLSALYLDGSFYLINPENDTYIELSETLMSTLGLDMSEYTDITSEFNMSDVEFTSVDRSEVVIDDEDLVMYTYTSAGSIVYFYIDGTDLVMLEIGDNSGNTSETLIFDDFSASIPANMLTVSGYTESGFLSFFTSMVDY